MRSVTITFAFLLLGLLGPTPAQAQDGSIVARGENNFGQCMVPSPNTGFVALSTGYGHSLGLKSDGTIVAWGLNDYGQCNVPDADAQFVAVAAGEFRSPGLKSDRTIVAWGNNSFGQCNVPVSVTVGFVAAAGGIHHSLGLKSDGSIVGWGNNDCSQCVVPTPNAGFVAIAAGLCYSLGLKGPDPSSAITEPLPGMLPTPLQVVPNPGTGRSLVRFTLNRATAVTVEVFDVSGARVRVLASGLREAGERSVAWNGRGDEGRELPSGVYLVNVTTRAGDASERVVLIK